MAWCGLNERSRRGSVRLRTLVSALLAGAALAACQNDPPAFERPKPAATSPRPTGGSSAPTPLPSLAPLKGLSGLLGAPASIISNNGGTVTSTYGGGIISNNSGNVTSTYGGGLISNNGGNVTSTYGGGLISNNGGNVTSTYGGGLIGNNSANYHALLAAGDDGPLVNALIYLSDRDEKFYANAATHEVFRATTDDAGRFRFPNEAGNGFPVDKDVLVTAMLPGNYRMTGFLVPGDGVNELQVNLATTTCTEFLRGEAIRTGKSLKSYDFKAFRSLVDQTHDAMTTGAIEAVTMAKTEAGADVKAGTFDMRADHAQDLRNQYAIAVSAAAALNGTIKALSDGWRDLFGWRPTAVTTLIGNGRAPRFVDVRTGGGVEGDPRGTAPPTVGREVPLGNAYGVAVSNRGDVFITSYTEAPASGHIRWIKPDGTITSIALPNYPLLQPTGVAVEKQPTNDPTDPGSLIVADLGANRVYRVAIVDASAGPSARATQIVAGDTEALFGAQPDPQSPQAIDGPGAVPAADGKTPLTSRWRLVDEGARTSVNLGLRITNPARYAFLNGPHDVAVDELGDIYIADRRNHRIRMVVGPGGDGRNLFGWRQPYDDDHDGRIDRYGTTAVPMAAGCLYTIVGDPTWDPAKTPDNGSGRWFGDYGGDGGRAQTARLDQPNALVFKDGYLYLADTDNQRVRRVNRTTGTIETVVGTPPGAQRHDGTDYDFPPGTAGDGGPAAKAQLAYPMGLAFDAKGRLIVADRDSGRLRMVAADGTLTTIAGRLHDPAATGPLTDHATDGEARFWADLFDLNGIDVDPAGNVIFCDARHLRVRKLWHQWD